MQRREMNNVKMYQEDIDSLSLKVHDWFVNHPLGTTEEGYDHFYEWFSHDLEPFSTGEYRNYN